jgi:hypothetical protein
VSEKRAHDLGTPQEIAAYLHTTPGRLAQMRHHATGPKYIRIGRRILYRWDDVREYLKANTIDPQGIP